MTSNPILITGAAGFIGYHLAVKLIESGQKVIGLDNINNYYDTKLKYDRLNQLGINKNDISYNQIIQSKKHPDNFSFIKLDLQDRENLPLLFKEIKFSKVCNLAAQGGVRYSLENPMTYIDSNIVGFVNLLECMRHHKVQKLVYASSSSVYGNNDKVPFDTCDRVDYPISLYAATKKSNELMAYTYSHLYDIQTIGLRFFTVYGPWGRPDMAMFLFTHAILNNNPIKVFNNGDLYRDFTYIDDIVVGVQKTLLQQQTEYKQYELYNIGNGKPVKLLEFIKAIEKETGKTVQKQFLPMQPGDVEKTWAETSALVKDFNYKPNTPIQLGINRFVNWYKDYYSSKWIKRKQLYI